MKYSVLYQPINLYYLASYIILWSPVKYTTIHKQQDSTIYLVVFDN